MRHSSRLERIARVAARRAGGLPTTTERAALLACVLAKAERALAGECLQPADWTNAPQAVAAHRERLLEWVRTKRD